MLQLDITEASHMFEILAASYNNLTEEQKELFARIHKAITDHYRNKLN
jgi:DNA replication initiation complex subunit (GINS family)